MKKICVVLILGLISFTATDVPLSTAIQQLTVYTSVNPTGNFLVGSVSGTARRFNTADFLNRAYQSGTQAISTVNGLQTALDAKQATGDYATNSVVSSGLATKQNTLVSGTSLKTINGINLLGSGDVTISGGGTFDTSASGTKAQLNKYYTDHAPTTDITFSAKYFQVVSNTVYPYGGSTNITASPGGTVSGGSTNPNGRSNGGWIGLTSTGSTTLADGTDLVIVTFGETYPTTPAIIPALFSSFPTGIRIKNPSTTGFTICASGSGTLAAGTYLFSYHVTPL